MPKVVVNPVVAARLSTEVKAHHLTQALLQRDNYSKEELREVAREVCRDYPALVDTVTDWVWVALHQPRPKQ